MASTNNIYVSIKGKDQTAKAFNSAQGRISKLMTSLRGMAAAYAAIAGVKWVIKASDEMKNLEARVGKASKGLGSFEKSWYQLRGIAQLTGSDFKSTAILFESLARTAPDIGATQDDILQLTENLQMMGIVSGASGEAMRNSMRQLGQAMAGGIVRAEEWNSILENTPEIAVKIAESMGMSVGQLRLMVVEGKLTSKMLADAVLGQTENIRKDFENMPMTFGRAFTMISNSAKHLLNDFSNSTGNALTGVAEGFAKISEWIDLISWAWTSGELMTHIQEMGGPLASIVTGFVELYDGIMAVGEALWDASEGARGLLSDTIGAILPDTLGLFGDLAGLVGDLMGIFADWVTGAESGTESVNAALEAVGGYVEGVKDVFIRVGGQLATIWKGPAQAIVKIWDDVKASISAKVTAMMRSITDKFEWLPDALKPWKDFKDGAEKYTDEAREAAIKNAEEMNKGVTDAGYDMLHEATGASYFPDYREAARYQTSLAAKEAIANAELMSRNVTKAGYDMLEKAYDWVGSFKEATQGMFDDIAGGVGDAFGNLFKDIVNGNKDAFKNFGEALKNTVIDAIAGGIKEVISNRLKDLFSGLGEKVIGGIMGGGSGGGMGGIGGIISKIGGIFGGGGSTVGVGGAIGGGGMGGGMAGAGGFVSKIIGSIGKGFSSVGSAVSGGGGALAGLSGMLAPLAIAGFGFMKMAAFKKMLRGRFQEAMSDPVIAGNLANKGLESGFKVLGEQGEKTFIQLGSATSKYFDELQVKGRGAFAGAEGDIFGSLRFGLQEMRDEFGNVVYSVKDVQAVMDELNFAKPLIEAKEAMDSLSVSYNDGVSDAQLWAEMFVFSQESMKQAHEAMADGFISKTEAMEMGFGKFAGKSSEEFGKFLDQALLTASGLDHMGKKGVEALANVDLKSRDASSALRDGFLSSTELAKMGLSGMREMGVQAFMRLVEGAKSMSMASREMSAATAESIEGMISSIGRAEGAMQAYGRAASNAANQAQHAASIGHGKLPGFATGGSFVVGGQGGIDTNVVAFKATKGEKVTIETPQQQKTSSGVDESHSLLAEIANSIKKSDANNVRAIQRAALASAANTRH